MLIKTRTYYANTTPKIRQTLPKMKSMITAFIVMGGACYVCTRLRVTVMSYVYVFNCSTYTPTGCQFIIQPIYSTVVKTYAPNNYFKQRYLMTCKTCKCYWTWHAVLPVKNSAAASCQSFYPKHFFVYVQKRFEFMYSLYCMLVVHCNIISRFPSKFLVFLLVSELLCHVRP